MLRYVLIEIHELCLLNKYLLCNYMYIIKRQNLSHELTSTISFSGYPVPSQGGASAMPVFVLYITLYSPVDQHDKKGNEEIVKIKLYTIITQMLVYTYVTS